MAPASGMDTASASTCSIRVGPSRRGSTIPRRPSILTSSSTSGAGPPAAKTARVMRASHPAIRPGTPALNSLTTCPGAQAWTSDIAPSPSFSPSVPTIVQRPPTVSTAPDQLAMTRLASHVRLASQSPLTQAHFSVVLLGLGRSRGHADAPLGSQRAQLQRPPRPSLLSGTASSSRRRLREFR